MSKVQFKSNTVFSEKQQINVDREKGIVNNVCIVQHGENKNGSYFNNQFLDDIVEKGNAQKQGVKSRFGHPNMCATSLGSYLGRYKNFRVSEAKVFANLHLDPISKKTQVEGKGISMHEYVLDMAESNPDMFGNSICISGDTYEEFDTKGELIHSYSFKLEGLIASDLVDDPAATDSLFSESDDLGIITTKFLDTNPEIFEAIDKNPSLIEDFFERYNDYLIKFKNNAKMGVLDNLKKKFGTKKTFDVEETTAAGDMITIVTEDETPKVGDKVNDADGIAVTDGDLVLKDGSILVITDGEISEMKEAEGDDGDESGDGDEPTNTEVMSAVNGLVTSFEAFKKQYKKDLKESQDGIEFVADTFETKFNNLAKNVKSSSPDYKSSKKDKKKFSNASGYDSDAVREAREARKNSKKQ